MLPRTLLPSLLITGMALGTAWAVRGQFGHEQGAAWAGGIGALALLTLAKREDWHTKMFHVCLAAAIGWGIGGVMSYGIVVGYGHGVDFPNVYYGFLMLFVIGGLYGFLGGGLMGLALEDRAEKPVAWPQLATQMVAGGLLIYGLFIHQWEWFMTPPRSEAWAGCMGMAFALLWYIKREQYPSALRVAIFAGLGAGFGFAFGNFLQVLLKFNPVPFNSWNVMEYSLGFFGGAGMAYGVFTSQWEKSHNTRPLHSHILPFLLLILFIPIVIWTQSFTTERLQRTLENLVSGDVEVAISYTRIFVLFLMICLAALMAYSLFQKRRYAPLPFGRKDLGYFFPIYFGFYILLSWVITGALLSTYRPEQYLYAVNFLLLFSYSPRFTPLFFPLNNFQWPA